jgi:predicted nuclease of restriction endonuclease-like (RecB) superfamily
MNKNQIINIVPHSYHSVLSDIIQKVNMARYLMIKTVNTETVQLYWQIGKIVSEKINIEKWGNSVVEKLSKDLQTEFPGVKGFSVRNIRYMKSFYETYKVNLKLQPLVAEIGWVQNSIIIEKCKDLLEREFYIRQIKDKGWSKSDLLEKIERQYYQNQLLSQNNFENTVSDDLKARVAWEFIDDYNIEILNPDQPIAKKELENSIVKNIVRFLD